MWNHGKPIRLTLLAAVLAVAACATVPPALAAVCDAEAVPSGAQAWFVDTDSRTRGNWQEQYGGDGYLLPNHNGDQVHATLLPEYVGSADFNAATSQHVWAWRTSDQRALQTLGEQRTASVAYGDYWSFTVTATAPASYRLSLYFLDWDSTDRAQEVSVHDAASDELLDRRSYSQFNGGLYATYELSGSVRFRFLKTAGWNAVVAGIFFDTPAGDRTSDVARSFEQAVSGTWEPVVLSLLRGEFLHRYRVGTQGSADAARQQGANGLAVRYFAADGYNRLIEQETVQTVMPGDAQSAGPRAAWAEWSGFIDVPAPASERELLLPEGAEHGLILVETAAGLCVMNVAENSEGAAAGIEAGDLFTSVVDTGMRQRTGVHLRLAAPSGGHLYLDGVRELSYVPCTEEGVTDCSQTPDLERGLALAPGRHRLRIASILQRREPEAAAPDAAGSSLFWRFGDAEEWREVPAERLSRGEERTWRRQPRQAAQVGLEWLLTTSRNWQRQHGCYGCHVQAQALLAAGIARDKGYRVSGEVTLELLDGISSLQNAGGTWHDGFHNASTQFGAMAAAVMGERGGGLRSHVLNDAVNYLRAVQEPSGRLPMDHLEPPVSQGDIISTANARLAFELAARHATGDTRTALVDAAERARDWLRGAQPQTNQDHALRILGLGSPAWREAGATDGQLQNAVDALVARQHEDGGWSETLELGPNAYATGQALYALRVAGFDTETAVYQRGMEWLMQTQGWTGAWPQRTTQSAHNSQFAATMWPVIALLNSYRAVEIALQPPGCVDGDFELTARLVAGDDVTGLRFSVDGADIGTAAEPTSGGEYVLAWNLADPGEHRLQVTALRDAQVVGHAEAAFTSVPPGAGCNGTLRVAAADASADGEALPSHAVLLLDASNSMWGRLGGDVAKIVAAKEALAALIDGLPVAIDIALRAYGHRVGRSSKGRSCKDTELLVPFGSGDRALLHRALEGITPRGYTPIGLSLHEIAADLPETEGRLVVVVVTDGIETCDPEPGDAHFPPTVVQGLLEAGIDVTVNVIGFDIADSVTREFLKQLAEDGGGAYYDAGNAAALLASLRSAVAAEFSVLDGSGTVFARGHVGSAPVSLPAGTYRLIVDGAEGGEVTIVIRDLRETVHAVTRD